MKKLFTFCATALLAFTLSAQSEHASGSIYLGTGDATQLLKLFSDDGISMSATIGYAVQDDIVVSGTVTSEGLEENNFDLGVTYYTKGFGFGLSIANAMESNGGERSMALSVGKYLTLGDISDHLYVMPMISMDEDQNMTSSISFGMRF